MNNKLFIVFPVIKTLFVRTGSYRTCEAVQLQPAVRLPVPAGVRPGGAEQVYLLQEHDRQPQECVEGGGDTTRAHGLKSTIPESILSVLYSVLYVQ